MKVIKEGTDWEHYSIKKTCGGPFGCGAILEVELQDLTRYTGRDEDGDPYDEIRFNCPCCGDRIYVDDKKLPYPALIRIKKRK